MQKQIIEMRLSLGWSQAELARRAGVERSYLCRVEAGKRLPSKNFLDACAAALGVTLTPPKRPKRLSKVGLCRRTSWIQRAFGPRYPIDVQPLRTAFSLSCYTPMGVTLVDWLDKQKQVRSATWNAIKWQAGRLNGPEQKLFIHALRQKGTIQRAHPHDTKLALPVVQDPADRQLAIIVERWVLFAQVKVFINGFGPRLDWLLVIPSKKPVHINIEIDGPSHKDRTKYDQARQEKIGLPYIRLASDDLERPDFWDFLVSRVNDLLARQGLVWSKRLKRLREVQK